MRTQFTIRRVALKNFISHKNTEIEFGKGVTVLIGPNGAGKTSILEAIYFALTGKGWRTTGVRKKDLINMNAKEAVVELEVGLGDNETLIIRRKIPGAPFETYLQLRRNGKVMDTARGEAKVNEKIREILGFDPEKLRTIAIIPQGGITRLFLELPPRDRKKMIDSLLGIDDYEEAYEGLGELEIKAPPELGKIGLLYLAPKPTILRNIEKYLVENLPREKIEIEEKLSSLKQDIKKKEEELIDLEKKIRELDEEIKNLKEKQETLNKLRLEAEKLKSKKEELTHRKEELEKEINDLKATVLEIEERLKQEEYLKSIVELEQGLIDYRNRDKEIKKLAVEIKQYEKEIDKIKPLLKRLKELSEQVTMTSDEINKRIEELVEESSKIEDELNNLNETVKDKQSRLAEIKTMLQSIDDRLKSFITQALKFLKVKDKDPRILAEKVLEAKKNAEEKLEKLMKKRDEVNKLIGDLTGRIKLEKEKLSMVESTTGGRCPLCGQPLTSEHREKIVNQIKENLSLYEKQLHELIENEARIDKEIKSLREMSNELAKLVHEAEEIITLVQRHSEIKDQFELLKKELEELLERKQKLEESHTRNRERIDRYRELLNKAKELETLKKLVSEEHYNNLQNMLKTLKDNITLLQAENNAFINKVKEILGSEISIDRLAEIINKAKDELTKLGETKGRLNGLRERIEKLIDEKENVVKELSDIEDKLSILEKEIQDLEEIKKRLEEASRKKEELLSMASQIRGKIEADKQKLKEYEEEIEALIKREKALRDALYRLKILQWIRENIYHRDKTPAILRRRSIRIIEQMMRSYLQEFELGYHDVTVDDDFNIYLKAPGMQGPIEISRLSGGERVVVSLIAMLALHRVVGRDKLGFLILDEPTEFLDEERRKKLIELLKKFGGGKIIQQLIIVTHDEEIREAADTLYRVEKLGNTSKVTPVSIGG